MTTPLGSLASLHRYPVKSMVVERLREWNPRSRCEPRRFRPNLIIDTGYKKAAAQHSKVQVGVYATIVQAGTIRAGDTISVV